MTTNTNLYYQHEFESALAHVGQHELPLAPYLDVTDDEVKVHIELPGAHFDDIRVKFTDYGLEVAARAKVSIHRKRGSVRTTTNKEKSYYRLIPVPYFVDQVKAKATFKDGLLDVVIPRLQRESTKNRRLLTVREGM
ncbi:MAG TPA: Hsp20/alpha crystallin family protein [Acidobacteriota bacterium]|nr:Hsp20/alpha crystallin family protein [Acidobacteriota bacterium]